MATYEWVLKSPVARDFECAESKTVMVEAPVVKDDGLPIMQMTAQTVTEKAIKSLPTTVVRLSEAFNDVVNHRLFVRFFYGNLDGGKFVAARLDDGVVFGGPTYIEHEFHTKPTAVEEAELLPKIAAVLKWDGEMRSVTSAP